jgi:hypothetical protein
VPSSTQAQTDTAYHLSASEVVDLLLVRRTQPRPAATACTSSAQRTGVPTPLGHCSMGARNRAARSGAQRAASGAPVERELDVQERSPAYDSRPSGRIVRTVAAGDTRVCTARLLSRSWGLPSKIRLTVRWAAEWYPRSSAAVAVPSRVVPI